MRDPGPPCQPARSADEDESNSDGDDGDQRGRAQLLFEEDDAEQRPDDDGDFPRREDVADQAHRVGEQDQQVGDGGQMDGCPSTR